MRVRHFRSEGIKGVYQMLICQYCGKAYIKYRTWFWGHVESCKNNPKNIRKRPVRALFHTKPIDTVYSTMKDKTVLVFTNANYARAGRIIFRMNRDKYGLYGPYAYARYYVPGQGMRSQYMGKVQPLPCQREGVHA